jgi:hypothetical protein
VTSRPEARTAAAISQIDVFLKGFSLNDILLINFIIEVVIIQKPLDNIKIGAIISYGVIALYVITPIVI